MANRVKQHTFSPRRLQHTFAYAGRGIKLLFGEPNSRIHLLATVCVIVVGLLVSLSFTEWAIATILVGGVWVTEAINTAIERMCDHVTPEQHPEIKDIKDISAGAVLLSSIIAVIAGLFIFVPNIISWIETLS